MTAEAAQDRINSFDALRLFASLCVFFSHQIAFAGWTEPQLGPLGISLASTGLYIFFALSGYLVFKSLARNAAPGVYFRARLLRIFPGAIVNTFFCVVLGAAITTLPLLDYVTSPLTWSYIFHNASIVITPTALELPGVLKDATWPVVNGSIWTIKYELICYVGLFVTLGCTRWLALPKVPLLSLLVAILLVAYVYNISNYPNPPGERFFSYYNRFNLLRFLLTFAFGALVAACEAGNPDRSKPPLLLFIVPATLIVFGPSPHFARAGIIMLLVLLVIALGRTNWFFSLTYRKIGDLSYGVFLYAYPIQNTLMTKFYDGNNFLAVTIGCTLLTLAAGLASWHLVEQPFLSLKARNFASSGARSAAEQ